MSIKFIRICIELNKIGQEKRQGEHHSAYLTTYNYPRGGTCLPPSGSETLKSSPRWEENTIHLVG